MVVATHAHEDNVGGLVGVYQYTTADKTLCPVTSFNTQAFQNFAASAKKRGGGITVPKAGSEYSLGSADVTILGLNSGKEVNDTSIVLRIDYGKTSFLFTGDATTTSEQALLKAGEDLSADVLKVACHGSADSTSKEFLSEVSPSYAVISVGENTDGHPTKELLDRLKAQKVKLFRTEAGMISAALRTETKFPLRLAKMQMQMYLTLQDLLQKAIVQQQNRQAAVQPRQVNRQVVRTKQHRQQAQ